MTEQQRAPAASLSHLLYSPGEYDDDAVRAFIKNNPDAARHYDFPLPVLLRVIALGASLGTIRLLCNAYPEAVREMDTRGATALHVACACDTTLDIVRLLYDRWPEAIAVKDDQGCTPLHLALVEGENVPPLEVVMFLVNKYPEALAEKDIIGINPLGMACLHRASEDDLVMFLIEKRPGAVKEVDHLGLLPLHRACHESASLKVVTLLVDLYPDALESVDSIGNTPLHLACSNGVALEAVQLLIERCPKALRMENKNGQTPLKCAKERRQPPAEVVGRPSAGAVDLLTALQTLESCADNDLKILDTLCLFQDMKWPGGVALVLNAFPSAANKMDQTLMPTVLSLVGRRWTLNTLNAMILDNPTLVKGGSQR